MINIRFSSPLVKVLFSFLLTLLFLCFFIPTSTLAQCLAPEASVLTGSCNNCFTATVEVKDTNNPVNGILNLEFTSYRGDGGSGGIPVTGIPATVIGSATFNVTLGDANNFGGVQITVTNSCCETTLVSITNFSSLRGGSRGSVKYIGNTCNAPGIQTVVFEASPGNDALTNNRDPNSGTTKGKRVFPDKNSPTDTQAANRKKVRIIAHTMGTTTGTKIFFKSYDVDDPSSDTLIDPNGTVGNDNRGTPKVGSLGKISNPGAPTSKCPDVDGSCWAQTNSSGDAIVELTVTMHPGDNFVVAANTDPTKFVTDANGTPEETNNTKVTGMLTVWRRLHVEADKMDTNAIEGNVVTGTIKAIKVDDKKRVTDFDLQINGLNKNLEKDRYSPGRLVIIVNQDNQITSITKITSGNKTNGTITAFGALEESEIGLLMGKPFALYDDDDYNKNSDQKGDEGEQFNIPSNAYDLMLDSDDATRNVFADAYIQPKFDDGGSPSSGSFPFSLNFNWEFRPATLVSIDAKRNSKNNDADDFWVVYTLFIYQGDDKEDHDPQTEDLTTGITPLLDSPKDEVTSEKDVPAGADGSLIALECSAEEFLDNSFVSLTVAHEIGHQFGLSGDKEGFKLMAGPDTIGMEERKFEKRHINILRWRVTSPGISFKQKK